MPILVPFVIDKAQFLYPKEYSEGFVPKLKFVFRNFQTAGDISATSANVTTASPQAPRRAMIAKP